MKSSSDSFSIRKYIALTRSNEEINAKISEADAIISGGAQLTLEQGAQLEVVNNKILTLASTGKLLIQTDMNSSTGLFIDALAGLVAEIGAVITIDVVGDMNTNDIYSLSVINWNDNSSIEGLSNFVKDETLFLTLNGEKYQGNWDYLISDNQFMINLAQIPESSAYAAIFAAFALGFALYRALRQRLWNGRKKRGQRE